MSTSTTESILRGSSKSVGELAQGALSELSDELGDPDLALKKLAEYFRELSITSLARKNKSFTVRFKFTGDDTERLIQHALGADKPPIFDSAPANHITSAKVAAGLLWISLSNRRTCETIRNKPMQINDLFKGVINSSKAEVVRLLPETYALWLPGFTPEESTPSNVKNYLSQDVLKATATLNGLTGTIKKVVRTCQLWIMYLDTEEDALALARTGTMALARKGTMALCNENYESGIVVKVQPFELKSLFFWCFKCQEPGHMQRECKSEHAWCGKCAERKHLPREECEKARRCVNCKDLSGKPMEGHRAWDDSCQFPATVEMRKKALARRSQDPWWWDSDNELKRQATGNANKTDSQQTARPPASGNKSTHTGDGQTDMIESAESQPKVDSHMQFTQGRRRSLESRPVPVGPLQDSSELQVSFEDSPSSQRSASPAIQDEIVVVSPPEDTGTKNRRRGRPPGSKNKSGPLKRNAEEPLSSGRQKRLDKTTRS